MTDLSPDTIPEETPIGPDEDDSPEALKAQIAALKDQALRYAADAENTRRRAEREINDARAYAISRFAKDLLGVADNLARPRKSFTRPSSAMASRPSPPILEPNSIPISIRR